MELAGFSMTRINQDRHFQYGKFTLAMVIMVDVPYAHHCSLVTGHDITGYISELELLRQVF